MTRYAYPNMLLVLQLGVMLHSYFSRLKKCHFEVAFTESRLIVKTMSQEKWDEVFLQVAPAGDMEVEECVPLLMDAASMLNITVSRDAIEEAVQEKHPGFPKAIDREDFEDILLGAMRFEHHYWILRKYASWEAKRREERDNTPIPDEVYSGEALLDPKRCVSSKHAEGLWM